MILPLLFDILIEHGLNNKFQKNQINSKNIMKIRGQKPPNPSEYSIDLKNPARDVHESCAGYVMINCEHTQKHGNPI